ncbi:MAG: acetyl/propionyl/methylcrotonyl-CoA carboxylase subunit alpha [Gammaproteobacteria bacterium]|nr:acetyl/propionyl/methylcrotonyl-CoA carboxylase subunit alpha [Gammaproteobacteria bacterium]
MYKKILVANRGEIACRVFKTARRMGISTVAVYSDADRGALHVEMADEAVHIGGSASAESYLVSERIVEACQTTGAEAVHPGYGFLAENADFRGVLEAAGINFIGPGAQAIETMGDKITSKKLAEKAGVNTIPGFTGVIKDAHEAVKIANEIAYPVMLKASAGGGGKGLRVARNDKECRDGFERAASEAQSSFGDDRIFVEKYIEQPRHIEIQIIADTHGNIVYLGERECSIQRRHQKVIEEAPSTFLDDAIRRSMGEQAVALAKAVDYVSAGTVEFIVDAECDFYFLEMNTRLQVEHPVTEFVTGVDLVELMIRVAAGEVLPFAQADVQLNGWALEARVYAEDPMREFLPSTGRLLAYRPPDETANVRVDAGVYEGGEVSTFYDPMIAKLVTYGDTRDEAIATMQHAIDRFYIRGVRHNLAFVRAVLAHERFVSGRLSTEFIAEEYPEGFSRDDVMPTDVAPLVAAVASLHQRYTSRAAHLSGQMPGLERVSAKVARVVFLDGAAHPVSVAPIEDGHDVEYGDRTYRVTGDWQIGAPLFEAVIDGQPMCIQIEQPDWKYRLSYAGADILAWVLTPRAAELSRFMIEKEPPDLSNYLISPMPGLLIGVSVEEGSTVAAGQEIAVVEAMKMENVLHAAREAVVKKVLAREGESLAVDQPIIEFA